MNGMDGSHRFGPRAPCGDLRVVRAWVKDRRDRPSPDVQRVVHPSYEHGKIITGPMQSHPAQEPGEGDGSPVKDAVMVRYPNRSKSGVIQRLTLDKMESRLRRRCWLRSDPFRVG